MSTPIASLFTGGKPPVRSSPDLTRILALPRRPPVEPGTAKAEALIEHITTRYGRGPRTCRCQAIQDAAHAIRKPCIKRPNYVQAWTLHEIATVGGVVGQIAVGGGKCHAAGTEVFDYATGRRRDVSEPGALRVATLGDRLTVGGAVAFPSGSKECVRVTLADGSSAVPSQDHPYLTARGWVHAGELTTGDFVAVAASMPEPERTTTASDDEVAFIAYMLSDGGCTAGNLSFTNMTPAVIDDWSRCAQNLGFGISETASLSRARQFRLLSGRKRATAGVGKFVPNQHPIRKRWGLYGLSKNKRAHPDVWGLSQTHVSLFINRFWACDGHVGERKLELILASEGLINDIRFLLLRLGVRSRKHFKQASYVKDGVRRVFPAWRLVVSGLDALRFLDAVGDVLGKENDCSRLRMQLHSTARNTNTDVVPVGPEEVKTIVRELGLKFGTKGAVKAFLHPTAGQQISRSKFITFCELWNYHGVFARFADPTVAWERVTSVEAVGEQVVYDLSVPGTHNFIANGIVVHNTFMDVMAAMAFQNCECAVLLVPSTLIRQLALEYDLIAEHFRVPTMQFHAGVDAPKSRMVAGAPVVHVMPYSRFQRAEATVFLDMLRPDVLIVDEAQNLASMISTRSSRYLRFAAQHPHTRFGIWSGTLTNDEVQDYAHHCDFALGDGSPLPRDPDIVDEWGSAINPEDFNAPPGALLTLCNPDEHVQDGFHRRLVETPGFIATKGASIDAEMEVLERAAPVMPATVRDKLAELRALWLRPDGEELIDALAVARCARELACGLYLRWKFIHGETDSQIDEWLEARKCWRRELRQKLARREPHLDSPLLCANAAARAWGTEGLILDYDDEGEPIEALAGNPDLPLWRSEAWPRWAAARGTVRPVTEAVRVDDFLARDAAAWGTQERGIIWYSTVSFGSWVAELSGFPQHGGGPKAAELIARERGDRTIIASIASHGTGRDGLQRLFKTQIVTQPPSSAVGWEQLLGRLSRIGQEADKVTAWLYRHTPEVRAATDDALRRALYVQRTMGSVQKLRAGWKVAA